MGSENRIWTHARATAVGVGNLVASRFQDLQDYWTFGWEFRNSELAPTTPLSGEKWCYQQFTCANGVITLLDTSRDWRGLILDIQVVSVTAANELPQQVNYDPNLGAGTWDYNPSFYTANGGTPVAVPVGTRWNPPLMANQYVFVASAAGGGAAAGNLCWSNNAGAPVFVMIKAMRTSDVR